MYIITGSQTCANMKISAKEDNHDKVLFPFFSHKQGVVLVDLLFIISVFEIQTLNFDIFELT